MLAAPSRLPLVLPVLATPAKIEISSGSAVGGGGGDITARSVLETQGKVVS